MSMKAKEILAQRVRSLRQQHGWSQDELAARAGLHRAYVGTIERCEKSVTLDTVDKLAEAFDVPVRFLFEPDQS